jgi:dolichol-phosphate mannosyltransferase
MSERKSGLDKVRMHISRFAKVGTFPIICGPVFIVYRFEKTIKRRKEKYKTKTDHQPTTPQVDPLGHLRYKKITHGSYSLLRATISLKEFCANIFPALLLGRSQGAPRLGDSIFPLFFSASCLRKIKPGIWIKDWSSTATLSLCTCQGTQETAILIEKRLLPRFRFPSLIFMELSVIVPVYNEERGIPEFLRHVRPILQGCTKDFEIIFCIDPSTDRTLDVIEAERKNDPRVKLVQFSRRFGQHMAILGGLHYSRGDAVLVIDVDLQDPPELIPEMLAKWKDGFDVVLAQRRIREGQSWLRRKIWRLGYHVINKIADVNIPQNTGEFRLMSRRVVEEVKKLKESHGFFRGMVALVGFPQTIVVFDRPERQIGTTKYDRLWPWVRYGFHGIFCFSTYALSLSTQMGFLTAGASFLLGFVYLAMKIFGYPFPWGNPTIVLIVLFLGGVQLISIGILCEYIGRIYEEVKERPKFIVERASGFDP